MAEAGACDGLGPEGGGGAWLVRSFSMMKRRGHRQPSPGRCILKQGADTACITASVQCTILPGASAITMLL